MVVNQSPSSNWHIKYFDAGFISIAAVYMLQGMAGFLPEKMTALYPSFLRLSYKFLLIAAAASIVYVVIANNREKAGKFNSEKAHAILFGLIRFWLAAGISSYGFAKILGTQFREGDIILRDTLIGDFNGYNLTWYYFGFSPSFGLIIGWLQIGGSILLLFRRTSLLGTVILLPVMVNIVMINLFYGIPPGATINSIVFTAGLTYLLLLHTPWLVNLFFKSPYLLPKVGATIFKNILRVGVVVFAFMSVYQYLIKYNDWFKPGDPEILGKWRVEQSSINGNVIPPNAWQTNSDTWATIYFSTATVCAIGSNPYYFDRAKRKLGEYSFDKSKHLLNISFFDSKDSLHASIDSFSATQMLVKGLLGKDTIILKLNKVKK